MFLSSQRVGRWWRASTHGSYTWLHAQWTGLKDVSPSKVGAQPSILLCEQGHFPQASASLAMAGTPSPLSSFMSVFYHGPSGL